MAIETYVLSDKELTSIAEWQAAIDAEGYLLKLDDAVPFEKLNGFLPTQLQGQSTGFECYHDDPSQLIRCNPDIDFDQAAHEIERRQPELKALLQNYLQEISPKSPLEVAAALREFMRRRLTKSGER